MTAPDEAIDWDDIDEAIQDAISNDEGYLRPKTLLHYLNKRGWTIAPAEAHDYPRPIERLGPIVPCRTPRDHVHVWTPARNIDNGLFCRECGQWEGDHDAVD